MVRRGDVGRRPESPRRTSGEIPEVDVGEIEFGLACGVEVQAHALFRKRLGQVLILICHIIMRRCFSCGGWVAPLCGGA
jgi:hypothetical protein